MSEIRTFGITNLWNKRTIGITNYRMSEIRTFGITNLWNKRTIGITNYRNNDMLNRKKKRMSRKKVCFNSYLYSTEEEPFYYDTDQSL